MGPSHGSTELIVSSPIPEFEVNLAHIISLAQHMYTGQPRTPFPHSPQRHHNPSVQGAIR